MKRSRPVQMGKGSSGSERGNAGTQVGSVTRHGGAGVAGEAGIPSQAVAQSTLPGPGPAPLFPSL